MPRPRTRRSVDDMATRTEAPHRERERDRLLEGTGMERRQLTAAGTPTVVLEGGDGPPLLLLHGPAGNAAHWLRVLPELTATHRVIAPDLPGHGGTDATDHVLEWLDAVIEQACRERPALAGHTLGAAIAARFAAAHGDRISRVVLVDALGLAPFEPAPAFGAALGDYLEGPA